MLEKRPAQQRGHANYGWLDTWHSFSFADYFDPAHTGWGALLVINDDKIAPARGFGMHGHRDMEIITVVLAGALQHQDSMGHGAIIRPGTVQRMSAGKGIRHSEANPQEEASTHLLQIWIRPNVLGTPPSYEEKTFDTHARHGQWQVLASPNGQSGGVSIQQDARLLISCLQAEQNISIQLASERKAYVHVIEGTVQLGDLVLQAGDGAKIAEETELQFLAVSDCEFLLFDTPP